MDRQLARRDRLPGVSLQPRGRRFHIGQTVGSSGGTGTVHTLNYDRIDVEFTRSSAYEAGYKVYVRRSDQTQWTTQIPAVSDGGAPAAGKKRLRVTGLQPSTRYCFQVAGYHALGESARTSEVCGSTVASPTAGWTGYSDTFFIRKPWDVDEDDRFFCSVGVCRTWVFSDDEPFVQGSPTNPRTEMAWDTVYSSGQRMWEADVYIVPGTTGSNIFQIFRAERPDGEGATDIRLRVSSDNGGQIRPAASGGQVFATNMYGRWFNLKVAHNIATRQISVYIDDRKVLTILDYDNAPDAPSGSQDRRFKNGVYGSDDGRAETRFRNITLWKRP